MPLWLGLLVVLAFVVRWLVDTIRRRDGASGGSKDTREMLLKQRYERGEVTREEYEERLRNLREGPGNVA